MRIVFAASEGVPFCKTGGLADVAGVLPVELARRGHRAALFLPYYRGLRGLSSPPREVARFSLPAQEGGAAVVLRCAHSGPVEVFLVDCPQYFGRAQLYQEDGKDYADNARRFAVFSRAVLEGARRIGWAAEVFHCHDWQTGLIPVYLRTVYRDDPFFRRCAVLFTIHNMAYQGLFPPVALTEAGLPESEFVPEKLEYYGKASYLKGGLVYADILNTVSPTYAREIQASGEVGMGMEGLLRERGADLFGVLNGLDVQSWDPASDKSLPRNYDVHDFLEGKAACKKALQKECGFSEEAREPLIGAVSRLDRQKGLDLALEALPSTLKEGARFVLVGHGDPRLESDFAAFARARPREAYYRKAFDDEFARRVYAACDIFLMPSRFEPCGLGQMIAMRYGALPLGTRTGGLADTIVEEGLGGNGFLAAGANAPDIASALQRALRAYRSGEAWLGRVRTAMGADFSWARAVASYEELYRKAYAKRT